MSVAKIAETLDIIYLGKKMINFHVILGHLNYSNITKREFS